MKPRITRPSHFELAARARKADTLVAYLLAEAERKGASKSETLNYVAQWPPLFWAIAARAAGVRMPSDDTITSVLATLSRAALIEQLAEARTVPTLDHQRDTRVTT